MLASNVVNVVLAYVWNTPRLALVLALPRNNVPMFALTSPVLLMYSAPATPAPPATLNAPVVVLVLCVVFDTIKSPSLTVS